MPQTSYLSQINQSCKYFRHLYKIQTLIFYWVSNKCLALSMNFLNMGLMFSTQVNDWGMEDVLIWWFSFFLVDVLFFGYIFSFEFGLLFLGYAEMFSISLSPPGLLTLITVSNVIVSKQDTQHWAREEKGWWNQQADGSVMKTKKMTVIEIEILSIFYIFFYIKQ